jgi:membrane protease subunit HflK
MMKRLKFILLLILICYLLTGLHQIRPEERAVVKRFGRIVAKPGPGLWVGLPWGIDRVERVQIATYRRVTLGFQSETGESTGVPVGQLLTGDENLVNTRIHVDYAIAEGDAALEQYVLQRDRVDAIIGREAEAALAEWVAAQNVDDVLLTGSRALPNWLTRRTQQRIEQHRLGVRIQQASVALLTPPDEVRSDFEKVNLAESDARTLEQRARQEESQRLREAEGTRYQHEQQAIAYGDGRRVVAKAESAGFLLRLEQYRELKKQNPEILTAIWWDEMGKILLGMKGRGRIDLLDHHLGPDGLDISQIVPPGKRR